VFRRRISAPSPLRRTAFCFDDDTDKFADNRATLQAADSDIGDIVVLLNDGGCRPVRRLDNSPSTPIIPRRAFQSNDCMPSFGETTHRVRCTSEVAAGHRQRARRSAVIFLLLLRRQKLPFGSIARCPSVLPSFRSTDSTDMTD
jgi:hypothetical protein